MPETFKEFYFHPGSPWRLVGRHGDDTWQSRYDGFGPSLTMSIVCLPEDLAQGLKHLVFVRGILEEFAGHNSSPVTISFQYEGPWDPDQDPEARAQALLPWEDELRVYTVKVTKAGGRRPIFEGGEVSFFFRRNMHDTHHGMAIRPGDFGEALHIFASRVRTLQGVWPSIAVDDPPEGGFAPVIEERMREIAQRIEEDPQRYISQQDIVSLRHGRVVPLEAIFYVLAELATDEVPPSADPSAPRHNDHKIQDLDPPPASHPTRHGNRWDAYARGRCY